MREYAVGAVLVVLFAAFALIVKSELVRLALLLGAGGVVISVWQLHRRARAATGDEISLVTQWSSHYRMQLQRQRDALHHVWIWYLGPLLPGMILFWIAVGERDFNAGNMLLGVGRSVTGIGVTIGVFMWVAAANHKAAQQLQSEIDRINSLSTQDKGE